MEKSIDSPVGGESIGDRQDRSGMIAYSDGIRSPFRRHSILIPSASDQDSGASDRRFRRSDHDRPDG